jgi:hypothetical protein
MHHKIINSFNTGADVPPKNSEIAVKNQRAILADAPGFVVIFSAVEVEGNRD